MNDFKEIVRFWVLIAGLMVMVLGLIASLHFWLGMPW